MIAFLWVLILAICQAPGTNFMDAQGLHRVTRDLEPVKLPENFLTAVQTRANNLQQLFNECWSVIVANKVAFPKLTVGEFLQMQFSTNPPVVCTHPYKIKD